jgi:hydrogenase expression/formation protein HypC
MCLAIPAQVKELDNETHMGVVDILGVTRRTAFELTPGVKVGDYVLVHAGFAIEIVSPEEAEETLALVREFPEMIEENSPSIDVAGGADAR